MHIICEVDHVRGDTNTAIDLLYYRRITNWMSKDNGKLFERLSIIIGERKHVSKISLGILISSLK